MKRKYYPFLFILWLIGILACQKVFDVKFIPTTKVSTPTIKPQVYIPKYRINPSPSNNELVISNPPILKIPVKKRNKKYSFRLAQNEEFTGTSLQEIADVPFALYNPHQALSTGKWYWQYKYGDGEWSTTQQFEINDNVPIFETPTATALIAKIPKNRPRVLVYQKDLADFRQRNKLAIDAKKYIQQADKALTLSPPEEFLGIPTKQGTTAVQKDKLAKDASKKLGATVGSNVSPLVKAYLLTGDEKYAKAAIKWANKVATYDPEGVTKINNFADSECMVQLAYVYDSCYDLLSPAEKAAILKNIKIRGNNFYNNWANTVEVKAFSAHVWQHILERFFKASLAVMGDLPEAEDWLTYLYELYLARSPVLGSTDGGWWNGNSYFGLNTIALIEIPLLLQEWTGQDFLDQPFYKNSPYWLMYSLPVNHYSEGFGNGTDNRFEHKPEVIAYMDVLSRFQQNREVAWYVQKHFEKTGNQLEVDKNFAWFRLRWKLPNRPKPVDKLDLPQARVFPENGTVNMHTAMDNANENLMVSMRSSPYGTLSHSHADQNSFNIQFGGEQVFHNSGYRPSMGVPHYTDWFKATKGHNTVLIDGKEQPAGSGESYGMIPRFLHGEQISYALGDASMAYDNEIESPQKAGLETFRRHLIFLRPSTIVIYDELVADHPADWSWLIHTRTPSSLDGEKNTVHWQSDKFQSQAQIFGSSPINTSLSTEFDPKPINFRGLKDKNGNLVVYKDHWHITAANIAKTDKMRFLTIIQAKKKDEEMVIETAMKDNQPIWTVNGWEIQAAFDTNKPPSFFVKNLQETAALGLNVSEMSLGKHTLQGKRNGSTLLMEKVDGKWIEKEAVDVLPKGKS